MDKCLSYLCKSCGTFDKVKPNKMNFITKSNFLVLLLLATIGEIFAQPCSSPSNIYIETIDFNIIDVSWDDVNNVNVYEVEYVDVETSNSEVITSSDNSTLIEDIEGGTYEFEIITHCLDGSVSVSYAIIHVVADNLEDVEDFCYDCYQKFKDCELLNSYDNCDCYDLCDSDVCCDFVTSGMVIITPPSIKQCDCSVLCKDSDCCKYIDNNTGAMSSDCEDCADKVRACNESVKLKSNKAVVPLTPKENCSIEGIYPNPFKNKLQLSFELQYETMVEFSVYDSKGQEVERLLQNEKKSKGKSFFELNTSDWNSGIYYSILKTKDGCEAVQKMLKIE